MRTHQVIAPAICGVFLSATAVFAAGATADIASTIDSSNVFGKLILQEKDGGLLVKGDLADLPPGKHGFHVHENGSCADTGKAAGGHFNPDKMQHGFMPKDGPMHAHPGDMGNVDVGQDGKAAVNVFLPGVTLGEGKYAVAGKAVIVHEKADDFSQPTGNAGGRIGCGIIQADAT